MNRPQTAAEERQELASLRRSIARGRQFGTAAWQEQTAAMLGLAGSLRDSGRLRKRPTAGG